MGCAMACLDKLANMIGRISLQSLKIYDNHLPNPKPDRPVLFKGIVGWIYAALCSVDSTPIKAEKTFLRNRSVTYSGVTDESTY